MTWPTLTSLMLFSCIIICPQGKYLVNSAPALYCTNDCAPFIPGAVAYWPLTLASNGKDLSGNENHATFVGLTYTDGPTGVDNRAVRFKGNNNSYAWVNNSPSMDIGNYSGFSFSGFIRLGKQYKSASLIDWSGKNGYGVFIVASPALKIQLHLYPSHSVTKHQAFFQNAGLKMELWYFIGVSYEKATGRATAFTNGKHEVQQLDKNIVAGTNKTSKVGLGVDLLFLTDHNYNGDMSCMMLFGVALTADDFKRVHRFCSTVNPTQTMLPNITVADIAPTSAKVFWTKSPGTFSGYNITIEREQVVLGGESVNPNFIPSSSESPETNLTDLVPGATYRVHVWHTQGDLEGRARSSEWFKTISSKVDSPDIALIVGLIVSLSVVFGVCIFLFVRYRRSIQRRCQSASKSNDKMNDEFTANFEKDQPRFEELR